MFMCFFINLFNTTNSLTGIAYVWFASDTKKPDVVCIGLNVLIVKQNQPLSK